MRLRAIALALRGPRRRLSGETEAAALATSSDAHSSFSGNRWTDTNRGETVVELQGEFAGRSENKQMASTEMPTATGMILRISPLFRCLIATCRIRSTARASLVEMSKIEQS